MEEEIKTTEEIEAQAPHGRRRRRKEKKIDFLPDPFSFFIF